MAHVAHQPPRELFRLASRIEAGIGMYLQARRTANTVGSQWESLRHGWTLTNLAIRHTEATALMARTDAALAPTAFVTARAAMETTVRAIWMLEPEDVWEREARWLALVDEGARLGTRHQLADDARLVTESESIGNFAEAVRAKLPSTASVPGTPSTDSLLARYGTGLDAFYVLASQFTHGTEFATRTYRQGMGDSAEYGDRRSAGEWFLPLSHAWQATTTGILKLIQSSGNEIPPMLARVDQKVNDALISFRRAFATALPDTATEESKTVAPPMGNSK